MKTTRLVLGVIVAGFLAGCADLNKDLPSPVDPGVRAHEKSWVDTASAGFHGAAIRANNWDMRSCQSCHGVNYAGGQVNSSCRDCHAESGGPENCATCHGGTNPAPPRDLSKNTATGARGVGAHQVHLQGSSIALQFRCEECHVVPGPVYTSGHIDTTPGAEVQFTGTFGRLVTGNGGLVPNPTYDTSAMRCSGSYCHGNWRVTQSTAPPQYQYAFAESVMVGANASPLWTGGSPEASCGTCHGLPPQGHGGAPLPLVSCGLPQCHAGVVDATGRISDNTKHMNGKINIEDQELPFR